MSRDYRSSKDNTILVSIITCLYKRLSSTLGYVSLNTYTTKTKNEPELGDILLVQYKQRFTSEMW